jgi:hypothetical protein
MIDLLHRYFAAGDGPFVYLSRVRVLPWFPETWTYDEAFGATKIPRMWLDYPFVLTIKSLATIGFSWWSIDKILWITTVILILLGSYRAFSSHISRRWAWLSAIIYSFNSYAILLVAGGQLGMALAYGLASLVVVEFIRAIDRMADGRSHVLGMDRFRAGLLMGLITVCDLRLAILAAMIIGAYWLYRSFVCRMVIWPTVAGATSVFVIPLAVTVAMHLYWVLPAAVYRQSSESLGAAYTGAGMVKFLSVADFTDSLSLLHPNWPDNLFGKVSFFRPEFLVIPLVAYLWLLMPNAIRDQKTRRTAAFFSVLSLVGAFLAKGANDPFGGVYLWLFVHVPGFVIFRDPTKFYLLTAVSFSVMIPLSLHAVGERVGNRWRIVPYVLFFAIWAFSVRQVITGDVRGNFRPMTVPAEYGRLADTIRSDPRFFRTLWIPSADKPAYGDPVHPVVTMETFMGPASLSAQFASILSTGFILKLSASGVRYVIVPEDLERKMFLSDYRFDPKQRAAYVAALDRTGLPRVASMSGLAVYENRNWSDLIDVRHPDGTFQSVRFATDTGWRGGYSVTVPDGAGTMQFRFAYDPSWRLTVGNRTVSPLKTADGFMAFPLWDDAAGRGTIRYLPQAVSVISLGIGVCFTVLIGIMCLIADRGPRRDKTS